jgi:hypothetical protein
LMEDDRHEASRRQAFLASLSTRVDARRVQSDHLNRVMADATVYEAQALAASRYAAQNTEPALVGPYGTPLAPSFAAGYRAPMHSPRDLAAIREASFGGRPYNPTLGPHNPSTFPPHFRRY